MLSVFCAESVRKSSDTNYRMRVVNNQYKNHFFRSRDFGTDGLQDRCVLVPLILASSSTETMQLGKDEIRLKAGFSITNETN